MQSILFHSKDHSWSEESPRCRCSEDRKRSAPPCAYHSAQVLIETVKSISALIILLFIATGSHSQKPAKPPAPPGAAEIRAEIQRIEDAMPKITDRGAALYSEAKLYVRLGDQQKAIALLKQCGALDQGFDPGDSRAFNSLQSNL